MSVFKFAWRKLGGHVHVTVFTGKSFAVTLASAGELVLNEVEWDTLRDALEGLPFVVVEAA